MSAALLCGLAAAGAAALVMPLAPRSGSAAPVASPEPISRRGVAPMVGGVLAGAGVLALLDGPVGVLAAAVVGGTVWRVLATRESPAVATERERAAHDLPYLILLLAAGLRSGGAATPALSGACAALPGPAADRLRPALSRLAVGAPPADVWGQLSADPVLAPLGAALGRSADTGASVVAVVERLAEDLAAQSRSTVEDRARTVGVRAALPLGLCLLPAFLLLGIVPLVASLLTGLLGG